MKSLLNWCTTTYRGLIVSNKKSRIINYYESGKYDKIPKLFRTERDYKEITYDDFPFLYYLISEGNAKAVSAFIKNIPFKQHLLFDENNPLKCNPLMFSMLQDKKQVAEILENQGFNLMIANSEGQNILHMAAIYRRKQAFFQGLRKKANHQLADKYGNTPLHYTCRAGELQMTEALLAGKPQKLPNQIHLYPIHMAIQSSNMKIIQLLKDDIGGGYPLFHPIHSAARAGVIQIIKRMIKEQPTLINRQDQKKLTPLHHAVITANLDTIDFLLKQNGLLINLGDSNGNTALHLAFMRDQIEIAKRLIDAKADLDIINDEYLCPVDFGLDSSGQNMKSFLLSLIGKSKRLAQWRSRMN